MCPLDYALAVALLTTSPDVPVHPNMANDYAYLLPTMHAVAISWEIYDPRQERDFEYRRDDFPDHLKSLREWQRDLRDAPPLHDCQRFPERSLINDMLAFNRTYRRQLANREKLDVAFADDLRAAVAETDRLHDIWDLVRDARTDFYYVPVRRGALKKLRELVGSEVYYSGCLPPHVPVWNFARID
jgi:hypothetical protein